MPALPIAATELEDAQAGSTNLKKEKEEVLSLIHI